MLKNDENRCQPQDVGVRFCPNTRQNMLSTTLPPRLSTMVDKGVDNNSFRRNRCLPNEIMVQKIRSMGFVGFICQRFFSFLDHHANSIRKSKGDQEQSNEAQQNKRKKRILTPDENGNDAGSDHCGE